MGVIISKNQTTNYVLYYNIINYFRTIMSNHPSIARVSYGDKWMLDEDEFPMYPLGNVLITSAKFDNNKLTYNVQLTLADKAKEKNDESIGSSNAMEVPYFGTDDTVDIHANTLSILNDLLSFTARGEYAFQMSGVQNAVPFRNEMPNGLAGWVCTFDLEAFNTANVCLYPDLLSGGVNGVQTDC